jgi:outer membrane protein assembly factor BamA
MRRSAGFFILTLLWVVLGAFVGSVCAQQQDEYRRLKSVQFIGNKALTAAQLQRHLKFAKSGKRVVPEMVEYDLNTNLKDFLKEKGFLRHEFSWKLIPLPGKDVALQVQLAEGPQYRLTGLAIHGFTVFSKEAISSQFHLKPGGIANYIEIERAVRRIKGMYFDRGFIDVEVLQDLEVDPKNQGVVASFDIWEGIQYRIAYVGIVGCGDQAEEDRLRARIDLHPGDTFSAGKLDAVTASLKKRGVAENTVEILDVKKGLLGIVFWLRPKG